MAGTPIALFFVVLLVILLVMLLVMLVGCGSGGARTVDATVPRVFFPRAPDSYEDFARTFPVERPELAALDGDALVGALVRSWLAGPTTEELSAGYLAPIPAFVSDEDCASDITVRRDGDLVAATLCGETRSAGVGENARATSSFEATVLSSGLAARAALLYPGGDRCYGDLSDDGGRPCLE